MRRLAVIGALSAGLLATSGGDVSAASLQVWAGEHGEYSRIAFRVDSAVSIEHAFDERSITLRLDGVQTVFDTSQANRKRRAHRVRALRPRLSAGTTELAIDFNCDCGAKVYRLPNDEEIVVVDISEGPSYPRAAPAQDIETAETPPAEAAENAESADAAPDEKAAAQSDEGARKGDIAVDVAKLQSVLVEQLLAASEQGIIDLAEPAAGDKDVPKATPEIVVDRELPVDPTDDATPDAVIIVREPELELPDLSEDVAPPEFPEIEDEAIRFEAALVPPLFFDPNAEPEAPGRVEDQADVNLKTVTGPPIDQITPEIPPDVQRDMKREAARQERWRCQDPGRLRQLVHKASYVPYTATARFRFALFDEEGVLDPVAVENLAGAYIRQGLFKEAGTLLRMLGPRDTLDVYPIVMIDLAGLLQGVRPPLDSPLIHSEVCPGVQSLTHAVLHAMNGDWDAAVELAEEEHNVLVSTADAVRRGFTDALIDAALSANDLRNVERYLAILQNDPDFSQNRLKFYEARRDLQDGEKIQGIKGLWKVAQGDGRAAIEASLMLVDLVPLSTQDERTELELLFDAASFLYRETDMGVLALIEAARLRLKDGRADEALQLLERETRNAIAVGDAIKAKALAMLAEVAQAPDFSHGVNELDTIISALPMLEGAGADFVPASQTRVAFARLLAEHGAYDIALTLIDPLGFGDPVVDNLRQDLSEQWLAARQVEAVVAAQVDQEQEEAVQAAQVLAARERRREEVQAAVEDLVREQRWEEVLAAIGQHPEDDLSDAVRRWRVLAGYALGVETQLQDNLVTGDAVASAGERTASGAAPKAPRAAARNLLDDTAEDAVLARELLSDG